ncbi:hypothetical protein [Janthinobacterium sp. B9-8]|uniref:hypothetical protein n=1 Tax=Janthinobacterium sp. B9-8 TaxID=1236179 RepID=UPI00061CECEC|nr:hypothetical protein [Janthinobacterium sp. B9-8]AMC33958.1 hypothetical protein VN23_04750 [Janthinobacterium sp. B9-8]
MMRKQRGVAIITAVLTAALVTTLAVAINWLRQSLWLRQLENQFKAPQDGRVKLTLAHYATVQRIYTLP